MSTRIYRTGDVASDTLTDFIMLYGFIATDGNVTHLRQPFLTSGYQVSAGKTLYVARITIEATGNPGWWKMGYADNDVGYNTATARTNGVMAIGTDDTGNNGRLIVPSNYSGATAGIYGVPDQMRFLWKLGIAGKYPFLRRVGAVPNDGAASTVCLWCVEL